MRTRPIRGWRFLRANFEGEGKKKKLGKKTPRGEWQKCSLYRGCPRVKGEVLWKDWDLKNDQN